MTSRRAGSVKQLFPVSSNCRHLERVLFIKAKETGFETFTTPHFDVLLPLVACQY